MQQIQGEIVKTDSLRNLVEFSASGKSTPRPAQSEIRDAIKNAKGHDEYVSVDIDAIEEGVPIGTAAYDTVLGVYKLTITPEVLSRFGEEL